jgi:2-methoxy-6-polyprenyl-1,4-benzoquinol methylase
MHTYADFCLGDIATKFLEYCRDTHGDHTAHATVVDINADMLRNGKKRFQLTEFVKRN